MSRTFVANQAETASEAFDEETIVVHFRNGTYSALAGSGAQILQLLAKPRGVTEIVSAFPGLAADEREKAAGEIGAFLDQLLALGLIVATEAAPDPAIPAAEPAYAPPGIETFTDLADLMAIDPIHEVTLDAGWPHKAPDNQT